MGSADEQAEAADVRRVVDEVLPQGHLFTCSCEVSGTIKSTPSRRPCAIRLQYLVPRRIAPLKRYIASARFDDAASTTESRFQLAYGRSLVAAWSEWPAAISHYADHHISVARKYGQELPAPLTLRVARSRDRSWSHAAPEATKRTPPPAATWPRPPGRSSGRQR